MEKKIKKTLLGIQKNNRKSTKRNKQTLLKNVVDYLRANSYFFGVKIKEPIRETKKKFIGKVMEYLKSDDYMYASLVYGPLTISVHQKLYYGYLNREIDYRGKSTNHTVSKYDSKKSAL
ncbi:hypothetical protein SLEP1_g28579 [Rubroshorea leprosula]|uniref:Uncharacterized protein n=1 Tax=Rubroshorea leprosula TaxID=152421 RepID=A0AAV5JZS6_9ROSI|nr:hypothetical protein SLEP1_g28579 [Rubroshorea leprosula]